MHDDDVEAVFRQREVIDVSLANAAMTQARAVEPRPRHRQHVEREIEAEALLYPRSEQFEHAPGAGAEIKQRAHRYIGERGADRFLHRRVGDMKLANAVPLRGMPGEIGLRRLRALRSHGEQALTIAPERGVVGIEAGHELARERRRAAPLRQTKEGPRPFTET